MHVVRGIEWCSVAGRTAARDFTGDDRFAKQEERSLKPSRSPNQINIMSLEAHY